MKIVRCSKDEVARERMCYIHIIEFGCSEVVRTAVRLTAHWTYRLHSAANPKVAVLR